MESFVFNIPTKIIFGRKKIQELNTEIASQYKNILIVTDSNIYEKTDIIQKISVILKHINIFVFKDVEENPSIETTDRGGVYAKDNQIDLVLGIGGGSSMDAAKGIAILSTNPGSIKDYIEGKEFENKPLPIVCIPTSSGTGSEATPFAVFTDRTAGTKAAIANPQIFPFLSVLDPELTYTMPASVVINTGLDALTHSIEAYLSTESFELNDQLALRSVKMVIHNLEKAATKNTASMDKMAYTSLLGGMAITHASTILPHIMGYPLTVHHNIPHGKANAIIMPAFLDYMKEHSYCKDKVQLILDMFISKGGINSFINNLGVSTKLSDYGVNKNEFDDYSSKVIVKGDVQITPAKITEEVIKNIYLDSY